MKRTQEKGITLIALVVTIIVLIILAGVSINLVFGQQGLITRANDASQMQEIASIKEQIQLEILSKQAEKLEKSEQITQGDIEQILSKYGTINYEEDGTTIKSITTKKVSYEIAISDIWNGTTKEDTPQNPTFTTVANAPDISGFNTSNTYYVAWDLTSSPYVINDTTAISGTPPDNWYDYTAGQNKWANIKTTGGGNDCYWVWIPRYAYKVPTRKSTAETIQIKFLQEKTNVPIGETEAITNTTPTPGEWVVHPAFTNVGNGGFGELTGIWVAKYEASSSSTSVVENPTEAQLAIDGGSSADTDLQVRVRPNVTSWRGITVGNIFIVCQNLTKIVDGKENSLVGSRNIDSHMMKNTEWGAVAYLSRSIYGKNGQVYTNPYYNNTTYNSIITGLCGNGPDYTTTKYDDTNTYKYNTAEGVNASTSGNVYGIYDMAGGAWEYVAGILSSKKSNSSYYNFSSINARYYDSYDSYNNKKYGDAVYETSSSGNSDYDSWDYGYANFPNSSNPVFERGGRAANGKFAGVFIFDDHTGQANTDRSFRPVVLSLQS